jgi:hypothetical protein
MRRREQNKTSQRAYRERQKKTQHELEQQISEWEQKHRALSESHSTLTEEVDWLKAYNEDLISYILAQQIGLPQCGTQLAQLLRKLPLGPCVQTALHPKDKIRAGYWASGIAAS